MKSLLIALAVLALAPAPSQAANHEASKAGNASAPASMAEGEVRRVDKETGKITLRHGEIKALDMPAMTMVFRVREAALLDKVKAGDKVRFIAQRVNGAFTLTEIERAE